MNCIIIGKMAGAVVLIVMLISGLSWVVMELALQTTSRTLTVDESVAKLSMYIDPGCTPPIYSILQGILVSQVGGNTILIHLETAGEAAGFSDCLSASSLWRGVDPESELFCNSITTYDNIKSLIRTIEPNDIFLVDSQVEEVYELKSGNEDYLVCFFHSGEKATLLFLQ